MSDEICITHGGDLSEPSGGTDRVTAIAEHLNESGFNVTLVVPEPNDELPDRIEDISTRTVDVKTHGVATQPRRALSITRAAHKVAEEKDAYLQFEHSTLAGVGTYTGNSDYLLDMHDFAFKSPLYGSLPFGSVVQRIIKKIETRGVKNADHIVVVSETMKEFVQRYWDVDEEIISVVPNGYFERRIQPYQETEQTEGRVAFLGTFHPKLDVGAITDIAMLPEVEEFYAIGDGNKREDLELASEETPSLKVTGRLPDEEAFDLVASSSVAINPQHQSELQKTSSPVKFAYYVALGVPSVVSQGPDMARVMAEFDAAVEVPSGGDFVESVSEVLRDDDRRRNMKEGCRELAKKWSWSNRLEKLVKIYNNIE